MATLTLALPGKYVSYVRVAPLFLFLFLAFAALACLPPPASYKMTVASMMGCNDSEVAFSKPDGNDDNWVRATGCGKTVDAICEATGSNSTGGRCIAIPAKLDDLLRWELTGMGCANPAITVGPAFQSREDYREYTVTGCGDSQRWKCSMTSDTRKRESCLKIL
jgi:hypothetical protein